MSESNHKKWLVGDQKELLYNDRDRQYNRVKGFQERGIVVTRGR